MAETQPTRKPMLLWLMLSFLLRTAARTLLWLLFHDPPRTTRTNQTA